MTTENDAEGKNENAALPAPALQPPATPSKASDDRDDPDIQNGTERDEEEEEEEETEPKLKYNRLTGTLGPIYRNGDATSSSLVAGDKMIIGTHNGNIHVITIPTFQQLRTYKAHSASITAVSVSPFPPPWPNAKSESTLRPSPEPTSSPARPQTPTQPHKSNVNASPRTPRQQPTLPATPSNSIYIATASIDGNVCVSSLVDPKDVLLRNFARPVQAVALSPEYKNDRTYLSGGLAGQLILTTGGKVGVSANANTNSAAAAASGWLGSIGLGSNTGKDTVLHSGEGTISIIKWSLSGRFVLWVNEQGIKIMRSNLKLQSADAENAWKRIGHVDRPNRRTWEEMASVWKARVEWIDDGCLEVDEDQSSLSNGAHGSPSASTNASESLAKLAHSNVRGKKKRLEKAVIGWGDTAWVIHVKPESAGSGKDAGERQAGSADIVHKLLFDDCIISGISLYTPSLMLVLAYRTRDDDDNPIASTIQTTPRRGVHHRQNGLQPELRLVEAATGSEVDVDTLTISRFETLTAADYHLNTLYVPPIQVAGPVQRGALESISTGIWDAGLSAGRIFSSGASIISVPASNEKSKATASHDSLDTGSSPLKKPRMEPLPAAASIGLKIFIQSPYDCVLAIKREPSDHLDWLVEHEDYKAAYELVDAHPETIGTSLIDRQTSLVQSPTGTPRGQQSLADFFADDSASHTTVSGAARAHFSAAEKEKRQIGDLWLNQLVSAKDYTAAGQIAGRVLGTSTRWEHWVLAFAEAGRLDDIAPYIPGSDVHPPLPSLVYEVVLGHYIAHDRQRFKEYLEKWDPPTYDIGSVTSAIEGKLRAEDVDDSDWRILLEALAKLYVIDGRLKEALRCYIRVQNADEAIRLIRDYHLLGDIADDIPGFLLLRVSKVQMEKAPLSELDEASSEPMQILVDEAYSGVVSPKVVVDQLSGGPPEYQPFLFFYMRSLWTAQIGKKDTLRGKERLLVEGRSMVEDFGDLAVDLFAEYDRDILMQFLRLSQSYAFEHASAVCEKRGYIPELVYLLSKTGQTKRALSLITQSLGDVSLAISFAKEQDDPDLWNDLLDYSMDKPRFIRGLLNEVGTSIDPITLVKRIPEGLEIEGLRDGIGRMVKEFEIQGSISEGVARVLRGEVNGGQIKLREGRRRGVKFEVVHEPDAKVEVSVDPVVSMVDQNGKTEEEVEDPAAQPAAVDEDPVPGHCVGCRKLFIEDEKETLIGFACGHVFHLSCLLSKARENEEDPNAAVAVAERLQDQLAKDMDSDDGGFTRSVGAKTAHARIIGTAIGNIGCTFCHSRRSEDDQEE
ncbi:hypothetical protein NA57DRAFT_75434 [Rhizodiscina lignyota]|uniref:Vps41 beta-propeller domain-containing protein n=1 Tax=Rhizodiscina lignyota TaxID=1504668 RepID=A0A9P4IK18_9PEZI|nr:hypothetical protein NA57DRAFT_75434 [Rhizodiscina lignyota]